MMFLGLWMLDGAAVVGVGGRREGATERAVMHSAAATTAPAITALIALAHDTLSHPPLLAGQRIYTGDRCDADRSKMPCLERRPVRVGCATGQLWGPTTRRLLGGKVYHSNVPI
jgi:hypothetical protein